MATSDRISELNGFCIQWDEILKKLIIQHGNLVALHARGVKICENGNPEDHLPTMIDKASEAKLFAEQSFLRMISLRDRATKGEDV